MDNKIKKKDKIIQSSSVQCSALQYNALQHNTVRSSKKLWQSQHCDKNLALSFSPLVTYNSQTYIRLTLFTSMRINKYILHTSYKQKGPNMNFEQNSKCSEQASYLRPEYFTLK